MESVKALTAAEKRAARRARVLEGGDRRLQLVTGQVASLKTPTQDEEELDQVLEDSVDELVRATRSSVVSLSEDVTKSNDKAKEQEESGSNVADIPFPSRIDPAQRRRDAAARRQRKEAMVQQLLGNAPTESVEGSAEEAVATDSTASVNTPIQELSMKGSTSVVWSRHSLALRLHSIQDKLILLVLVSTAVYLAYTMDVHHLRTDLFVSDPLFLNYQQLVSQGVSIDVIRSQMQREQVPPALMQQVEQLFTSERKRVEGIASTTFWATGVSQWFPNVLDWPHFWMSLLYHPPILIFVVALRMVLSVVGHLIHSVLDLPDVKSPQEDDLGMVLNLVLANRPALKGYIVQSRKAMDELFFFLWCFVLVAASRVIIEFYYSSP